MLLLNMADAERMKAQIEEFEIDVDVTDRVTLYDYATCRYVRRSKQDHDRWRESIAHLGGTEHIDKHDENMMMQVRLMDRAIADIDKAQASKEEVGSDILFSADFDHYTTSLKLPRRVLPFYRPGDVLRGYVHLKLSGPTPANAVQVNLLGEGVVNVKTYDKYAYYDECHRETYINEVYTLWRKTGLEKLEGGKEYKHLIADVPRSGDLLEAGLYRWPFEFTIPLETSQSTPNLLPTSQRSCYVIYRLKAKIKSGQALGADLVTHKGLWVEKEHDIAGVDPEKLQTFTTVETLDTGMLFKPGHVSVKATLPRCAFVKGDEIPLRLEISNDTAGVIDSVTAFITMHGHFKLSQSKLSPTRSISLKSAKKKIVNVTSGNAPVLDWFLSWDFSGCSLDGNLMPTGTLTDCKLIDIKYDLVVKVKRAGLHRNMELQIPLFIGNKDTRNK